MKSASRLAVAILISGLPLNALRCLLYKCLLGYATDGAKIGFGTVINVREAFLEGCTIGRFNKFLGPMKVSIGLRANIESHNTFDCGDWAADARHCDHYARTLTIEPSARITNYHFFDLAGQFVLGQGSWIAGRGSQFWTHGVNVSNRNIHIGKSCYIGSSVRFAPGSGVGDNVIVGIGSVVTKKIDASNALISGFPAQVVKDGRGWTSPSAIEPKN